MIDAIILYASPPVERARRWSRAWKKAAKRGEVDGEALCVLQNAWAEQGARIAELEKLLREGVEGFGRALVQTSDAARVQDWRRRARGLLGTATVVTS